MQKIKKVQYLFINIFKIIFIFKIILKLKVYVQIYLLYCLIYSLLSILLVMIEEYFNNKNILFINKKLFTIISSYIFLTINNIKGKYIITIIIFKN